MKGVTVIEPNILELSSSLTPSLSSGLDASEAVRLRGYLDYVRLSRTAERYLAIIENTKWVEEILKRQSAGLNSGWEVTSGEGG